MDFQSQKEAAKKEAPSVQCEHLAKEGPHPAATHSYHRYAGVIATLGSVSSHDTWAAVAPVHSLSHIIENQAGAEERQHVEIYRHHTDGSKGTKRRQRRQ